MQTRFAVQNAMFTNALRVVVDSAFENDKKHIADALHQDVEEWLAALKPHQRSTFDKYLKRVAMLFIDMSYNAQTRKNDTVKFCALVFVCMQNLPLELTDRAVGACNDIAEHMAEQHGKVWDGLLSAPSFEKKAIKAIKQIKEWGYFNE